MQLTSNFVRTAVTGAAAIALLTACSGGSDNSSASSTSASKTTSSAATSTAAGPTGTDAAFCQAVPQLVTQLGTLQAAQPAQVPAILQQLSTGFQAVTPPAAIASDWQALGAGLQQFATAISSIDVSTPQGQQQLAAAEQQATAAAAPHQGNISAWVLSNCGGASGSASSSSAASTTS
jgi:hypothetical protein